MLHTSKEYAFPANIETEPASLGMTLRDYFAAKAMQAYATSEPDRKAEYIAKDAYDMADVMLKAREL